MAEKAHPSGSSPQRPPTAQQQQQPATISAAATPPPAAEEGGGKGGGKGGGGTAAAAAAEAADASGSKERVRPQEHSISGGLIDMLVKDVILDKVLSAAGRVETAFLTHGSNSLEVKDDDELATTPHPPDSKGQPG